MLLLALVLVALVLDPRDGVGLWAASATAWPAGSYRLHVKLVIEF